VGLVVFILILFAGIFLSLFGLPGTVVIFFDVLLYSLFTGFGRISWQIIFCLLIFSIIAEANDFLTGMAGALQPMGTKNSFLITALTAIAGAFVLTPVFLAPGAFVGFCFGGFAGMLIMEFIRQGKLKTPFKASKRAIFTMIGGRIVKGSIALAMIAVSLSNIYS
jgi:hypothetical protein